MKIETAVKVYSESNTLIDDSNRHKHFFIVGGMMTVGNCDKNEWDSIVGGGLAGKQKIVKETLDEYGDDCISLFSADEILEMMFAVECSNVDIIKNDDLASTLMDSLLRNIGRQRFTRIVESINEQYAEAQAAYNAFEDSIS